MIGRRDASSLEDTWRRMAGHPEFGNRELDPSLQVPLVVGCTPERLPYIMILSGERPKPMADLEVIDVRVGSRMSPIAEDWSLTFILRDWSLLHAFAEICLAFEQRVRIAPSKKAALREIYATVDQWRRLMKTIEHPDRMNVLRGVCGELIAASEIMRLSDKPVETVMGAWTGPYGAPQDYSFDAERRYWEVKAIRGSAQRIRISSPEQLGTTDRHIGLIVVVLDMPTGGAGERLISLPEIVRKLREEADDPYLVGQCIDNGLNELGVDPYSDVAMHTMFAVGPITVYDVREGFPRVVPEMLPDGVAELTYSVERAAIEPFAIAAGHRTPTVPEE